MPWPGFEPGTIGSSVLIPPEEFDLKSFYEKHKAEFSEWLKKKVNERTAKDYLSALEKLPEGIREPKDLDKIVGQTKYLPLGIRNFLNFLEEQYYTDTLGGFGFSLWRKHLPAKTGKKRGEKIFVTDEDIREAYRLIKEKWKDEITENLFKLMVFSGIRLEHAYQLLSTFDKRKLIIEGEIAMYPIEELTKGKKKGYFAFMPAEFAKKLKRYEDMLEYQSYQGRLTPSRWKGIKTDNPVTPVRIRSWFQNFAIENGMRTEALRFIVGHSALTVGEAHYYNMRKIAKEEYRKIVDKFPISP